jgi:hypothetical protein
MGRRGWGAPGRGPLSHFQQRATQWGGLEVEAGASREQEECVLASEGACPSSEHVFAFG